MTPARAALRGRADGRHGGAVRGCKMRTEFLQVTAAKARQLAPWAAKIVKVDGGYRAFESLADYETWKRQK